MEIKIVNNIPDVKATINKTDDGSFVVYLEEEKKIPLGEVETGSIVRIGDREYIVLEHRYDFCSIASNTTKIITKDFVKKMWFGQSEDYLTSDVRRYCNDEFYNELAAAVGAKNIRKHEIKLIAEDGTGKDKFCRDNISVLTIDDYRRHRGILEPCNDWWWTATRSTYNEKYSPGICCVDSNGIVTRIGCGILNGVRPCCILNSSTLVNKVYSEKISR